MATLNNPIRTQNIIDRFVDYVVVNANANISWGIGSKPFTEMPDSVFGGSISGKSIGISGANLGSVGSTITSSTIYNTLISETNTYTRIRNMRALLFVEGGGGNTGSRPTAGFIYDQTAKANMNTSYLQNIGSPSNNGVSSGSVISSSNLETFFTTLQNSYNTSRNNVATVQINVCHASCHSSCHGSRGRR